MEIRTIVPVVGARQPVVASVRALDLHGVLAAELLELVRHILFYELGHLVHAHVRHRADRELADHASGHDRLVARVVERTLNTVEGQRRVSPAMLQNTAHIIMDIDLAANGVMELLHLEGQVLIRLLFLI